MAEIPTTGLTESALRALRHEARLLAEGFTGKLTLVCNQGGVVDIEVNVKHRPKDLEP